MALYAVHQTQPAHCKDYSVFTKQKPPDNSEGFCPATTIYFPVVSNLWGVVIAGGSQCNTIALLVSVLNNKNPSDRQGFMLFSDWLV
jgi:hypothetical protein